MACNGHDECATHPAGSCVLATGSMPVRQNKHVSPAVLAWCVNRAATRARSAVSVGYQACFPHIYNPACSFFAPSSPVRTQGLCLQPPMFTRSAKKRLIDARDDLKTGCAVGGVVLRSH